MTEPEAPSGGTEPAAMSDEASPAPRGVLGLVFLIGALALLTGMATDFVAVVTRHLGVPVVGAIEIIQCSIVLAVTAAGVAATLTRSHATVHLVTERLPELWRGRLARVSDLLGFLAFGAVAVGEAWLAADTAGWDERSDLLGLPVWPLRLIWTAGLVIVAVLFLGSAFKRARPS